MKTAAFLNAEMTGATMQTNTVTPLRPLAKAAYEPRQFHLNGGAEKERDGVTLTLVSDGEGGFYGLLSDTSRVADRVRMGQTIGFFAWHRDGSGSEGQVRLKILGRPEGLSEEAAHWARRVAAHNPFGAKGLVLVHAAVESEVNTKSEESRSSGPRLRT
jgi:hypothetical protein